MSAALPRYVVFGEALTDMIRQPDGRWVDRPGGSCWNVARVGARLGVSTGCATSVSRDYFGDVIVQASADAGLDLRYLQPLERSPLLAMVTSTHPPQYRFVGDDSADLHFDAGALPQGWLEAAEVLHFGGISLARLPAAERLAGIAAEAAAAGRAIAFDPNIRISMREPSYRARYERLLRIARYIKVSDDDLAALYPGQSAEAALAEIRAAAPQASLMFTRGAQGLTLLHAGEVVECPAFAVEVVDTVGCGDAAMGCWMATLLQDPGASLDTQARRAAAAAAVAAGHEGAWAPLEHEVQTMLQQGVQSR